LGYGKATVTLMAYKIHDKDPKVYIVLGAPHSATSMISKAIHEQGIPMAPDARIEKEPGYWKRYYQDRNFVNINKLILRATPGGRWNTPPTQEQIMNTARMDENIEKVIKSRKENSDFWGWKDTRTSFTLKKYLPHLEGNDIYLICCFRKPQRIVESYKAYDHRKQNANVIDREGVDKYNRIILEQVKDFVKL